MYAASVATEVVKVAVGGRHGRGRCDAQGMLRSIGGLVDVVGSVVSAGLGGGGGVAESSRVEGSEWLGCAVSGRNRGRSRCSCSTFALVRLGVAKGFRLRMLVRRGAAGRCAGRRLLHGRHGGSLALSNNVRLLGWTHKPRRARSCLAAAVMKR